MANRNNSSTEYGIERYGKNMNMVRLGQLLIPYNADSATQTIITWRKTGFQHFACPTYHVLPRTPCLHPQCPSPPHPPPSGNPQVRPFRTPRPPPAWRSPRPPSADTPPQCVSTPGIARTAMTT